ncbi:MAG: DNA ligase D [Sphingobium sp.]
MPRAADPLDTYNAKRDFTRTQEPKGQKKAKASSDRFVVQKHDATRLHYDFRLEVDGVLKSWAVTRGPSIDPDDKRLAVRTEDHPLDYADFEGTIPAKSYGGGTVMLWDEGTWAPIPGKSAKDIEEGHLHFTLAGQRMKGEWLLVRMKGRPGEKRENWLLRKVADAEAGQGDVLVERELTSIRTGRTMQDIASGKSAPPAKAKPSRRKKNNGGALPAFRDLQLATLVDHVPTGSNWMHEIKFDGYRCLLSVAGEKVKIFTRTGLDWTDRFTSVAEEAATLDLPPCLIDGEVVAMGKDGNPSFSALQNALKEGGHALTMFAFDLLDCDGEDLTALPNIERKTRLAGLLPNGTAIRVAEHVIGAGEQLFDSMCGAGQEGIISKRADAPYSGRRSRNWVKVKCTRRQEFVIVGWGASEAKGRPFKSLLLAQHRDGALHYAGKVGTGFNGDLLNDLAKRMKPLAQKAATIEAPRSETRGAQWIKPELVAEIAFAEFTEDGILRHASFLGLREDKPARDVQREDPVPTPNASMIKISSADRVIFPDSGITKGQLAAYYQTVGPLMLPVTARRPISLVRCPQGRAKQCFFQKHDSGALGDAVHHIPILEKNGKNEDYLYVEDVAGLLACVQMGTIEFHGWGSRVDAVEYADRMIFDLDPDEGMDFDRIRKAAQDIQTHLADIGLVSFPMLSGGKGIHVVVPLTPTADWPKVKDFASRFAQALAQAEPDRFVATMSKAKRKDRIFIDWLRNQRGSTAVMPYSVRARPGAPVAVPISWRELPDMKGANVFSLRDGEQLLARAADLADWGMAEQELPDI